MPHSYAPAIKQISLRRWLMSAAAACVLFASSAVDAAPRAPDPTASGPYATTSSEYHLPPGVDPQVDASVVTELWARIYRPTQLGMKPHPLVVILHGNHGTCGHYVAGTIGRVDDNSQYTTLGTCPDGYIVTPNHLGYEYMATKLASWGYIVVSINANRGVTAAAGVPGDAGLNLRRGRLVLRHLEQLAAWNRAGGAPPSLGFDLTHTIDFSHVGLMGHSRGGEGQLAAYTMYFDPASPWPARIGDPVHFEALFELAPVDGQTSRTFVANNIPWTVLLPLCDGDVNTLQGVRVYDRTIDTLGETQPAIKTVYAVWGANHDFYNTQWQTSDSKGCTGTGNTPLFDVLAAGSATQQQTGLYSFLALMRGYVGRQRRPELANLLNVDYALPKPLTALSVFERSFSDSAELGPTAVIDDLNGGTNLSSGGVPDQSANVTVTDTAVQNHDATLHAAAISWQLPEKDPAGTFFQTNWTPPGTQNTAPYATLEFRVALQCTALSPTNACGAPSPLNANATNDFSIALARPDGTLTRSVRLSRYATVQGPVGGGTQNLHPILQTVRIPIDAFDLAPFGGIGVGVIKAPPLQGVRFIFDRTTSGAVYLANVRLSERINTSAELTAELARESGLLTQALASRQDIAPPEAAPEAAATPGQVMALRRVALAAAPMVEIALRSPTPIPVQNSLLTLVVDGKEATISRFGDDGSTSQVIFSMPQQDFDALPDGAPITLRNGEAASSFGTLDKSMLK